MKLPASCLRNLYSCTNQAPISVSAIISRRDFFNLPFQPTVKKFRDEKIVKLSNIQLYNVVANVDDYREFVPNCIDSSILYRSTRKMEAELIVGIPTLLTERYSSIITLDEPNRIHIRTSNSSILKHLESEWRFEPITVNRSNQTLVTFRVEFEFYSTLHSNIMNLFFDDLTRKTMDAFISRALAIHSEQLMAHNDIS